MGWTPDGRIIAQEISRREQGLSEPILVTIDPRNKQRQRLISGEFVGQSDDLRTVLYLRKTSYGSPFDELHALSLNNKKSQFIYKESVSESLGSNTFSFSAKGTDVVTDITEAKGTKTLLVYNLQTNEVRRMQIPLGKTTVVFPRWLGEKIVVSVETLGMHNFSSETLLMGIL